MNIKTRQHGKKKLIYSVSLGRASWGEKFNESVVLLSYITAMEMWFYNCLGEADGSFQNKFGFECHFSA